MMAVRERSWWYPYIFAGLLGVVMAVNGLMAYFATSTFNGVITENAYEKGVNYNKTLDLARQQAALGWSVDTRLEPEPTGHKAKLVVSYVDKNGDGVVGLDVQALVDHPNVTGEEQRIAFVPQTPGQYEAEIDVPHAGQWSFDVLATGAQATYQFQRRFVIP